MFYINIIQNIKRGLYKNTYQIKYIQLPTKS